MNNIFVNTLLEGLNPIFAVLIQILICIISVVGIRFINIAFKKIGININDSVYKEIIDVVTKVVKTVNQTFVDDIKAASPDGKLSELDKENAYNMAYDYIIKLLSEEQISSLIDKYGNLDEAIKIMIESSIAEYKTSSDTSNVLTENITTR